MIRRILVALIEWWLRRKAQQIEKRAEEFISQKQHPAPPSGAFLDKDSRGP